MQVDEGRDGLTKSYDIISSESISLALSRKKEIISIVGVSKLPDSVIPARLLQYVTTHYLNNVVSDWELDDKNQQIELDYGLNLEFNMKGDF